MLCSCFNTNSRISNFIHYCVQDCSFYPYSEKGTLKDNFETRKWKITITFYIVVINYENI